MIHRSMITKSNMDKGPCLWFGQPERLAVELFPDDPPVGLDDASHHAELSRGDLASICIYGELEAATENPALLNRLEVDQIEDWLASRAFAAVIHAEDASRRLHG